jgi:hypothetical protein
MYANLQSQVSSRAMKMTQFAQCSGKEGGDIDKNLFNAVFGQEISIFNFQKNTVNKIIFFYLLHHCTACPTAVVTRARNEHNCAN